MRALVLVGVIAGCSSEVGPPSGTSTRDPVDTSAPEPTEEEPIFAPPVCGDAVAAGLDPLVVDWCARVSPEPDQVYPDGSEDDEHGDTDHIDDLPEDMPRCGYFNQIGAVGLSERLDAALYCDSDRAGGLRLATWDAAEGHARRQDLAPEQCTAHARSGALGTRAEGWIAAWTAIDSAAKPVLRTMPISAAGERSGDIHVIDVDEPAAVAFAGDALFAVDGDGEVRAWSIADDGAPKGPPARLGSDARALSAARTPDGAGAVAVCNVHGFLSITRLDTALQPIDTHPLPWMCAGQFEVNLALAPDGTAAVTWADSEAYWLAIQTPTGAAERFPLAGIGAAAWTGDGWLLATGDGHVARLDASGAKQAEVFHPALVAAALQTESLRVVTDGERATFLMVGSDGLSTGDHFYAWDFLELSSATVPF